jgi:hypothetical protein
MGGLYAWTVPAETTDEAVLQLEFQGGPGGTITACSSVFMMRSTTSVEDGPPGAAATALVGVYPNPFNPRTSVVYALAGETRVRLTVLDALGRRVRTLVDRREGPGRREAVWDGRDARGQPVSSGVYFACLETARGRELKRMVLVR